MKYIHVRSLDKYHPGYTDRKLMWARIYFDMFNAEPDFEMATEIDRYRLIFFIVTELQLKKPIPVNIEWLKKKGLDLKSRPILNTMESLAAFLEIQDDDKAPEVTKTPKVQPFKKVLKTKYLEYVELSDGEFLKLQEKIGGSVHDYISRLNGYIGQIGERKAMAKYVSHYHTILNWYRKDVADGKVVTNGTHSGIDKEREAELIAKKQREWNTNGKSKGIPVGDKQVESPF